MISVVMTTYNEAANLSRCLDSVKDWADEIIVVDGSSTDATREIAKKFGAKIIKTTNKLNFHINKQMAMDQAKGDLIFQIDADETVDEQLAGFIKSTEKKQKAGQLTDAGWWVKRKNLFLGRWLTKGGQYPDPIIRLYLAGKAALPQKDVHEQMIVEGSLGWADGHLLHYANPAFEDYVRKFNTYTSFRAELWQKDGLSLSFWNSLLYLFLKPIEVFLLIYFRHKGFMDKYPGFVFALMSGMHYSVAYLKLWELKQEKKP